MQCWVIKERKIDYYFIRDVIIYSLKYFYLTSLEWKKNNETEIQTEATIF